LSRFYPIEFAILNGAFRDGWVILGSDRGCVTAKHPDGRYCVGVDIEDLLRYLASEPGVLRSTPIAKTD
jgi:hypothetical protein